MNKPVKPFVFRFVSVLLSALILISTVVVGLVSTNAIESSEIKAEKGNRLFTVITTSEVQKAFCYWEKDESENGFVKDESPKAKGETVFWNFVIPDTAVAVTVTSEDHWTEDVEAMKLTDAVAIDNKLSDHIVINLTKENPSLADFAKTTLKVAKQDKPVVYERGSSAEVVKYDAFTVEGTLAEYVDSITAYEGDVPMANITKENPFVLTAGILGKHTYSFAITDAIGNVSKADNDYVVYCKTNRDELTFAGESPVSMVYGASQAPLALNGLAETDEVTYSSSDETVAIINEAGEVEPVGIGSAIITAKVAETDSYFEASASYTVEVNKGEGSNYVYFTKSVDYDTPVEVPYGTTYENPVYIDKAANPEAVVVYTSNNENAATVDENGKVNAVAYSDTSVIITANVSGLSNYTDAQLSYQVFVVKAEMNVPKEDIKSETVEYKPDLTVDCSDNFKLPVTEYTVKYAIASQKSLDNKEIKDAASIDEAGILKANRSGIFEIKAVVTTANYKDKEIIFTVTVNKAERKDFKFDETSRNLFVGCSYNIEAPAAMTGVEYSIDEKDKEYAKLEGNRIVGLEKNTEGVPVTVSIKEDDCYKAADATITFVIDYFTPAEIPPYSISGIHSTLTEEPAYTSDVVIKPEGDYKIALYDENAANNTELEFFDSVTLSNNISNPRIVLKSNSSAEELTGAVSDVIDIALFLDKTEPAGEIKANEFNKSFNSLLEAITFGLITTSQTFTITAEDNESDTFESGRDNEFGDVKIEYYIDFQAVEGQNKSVADLDALDVENWTVYEKEFTVEKQNGKSVIYTRLTDPFGNRKYICTDGIVYDNTHPTAYISYDNNDVTKRKYFNKPRTATVVVKDDNFEPVDGMFAIEALDFNGNQIDPPEVQWKSDTNEATATIAFTEDGEYTLNVTDKFVDFAGNKCGLAFDANTKCQTNFIIDTTPPEVVISYENNSASQGKYFDDSRRASILVTDGNFSANDDMISITAVDAEAPAVTWNDNQGTVIFDKEGEYTLSITDAFTDKAGNKANVTCTEDTVAPYDFVVDKTKPEVEVKFDNNDSENSFFNSARTATITVTDKHFTPSDDMIAITAHNAQEETLEIPEVKWDGNVATIVFEKDAHYTLEVTDKLVDMAGNGFDNVTVAKGTKYESEFTIDTVEPNAIISYDNNNASNEKYFNGNRKATITVTEDHFVGTSDMFKIVAKNAQGEMKAPELVWDGNVGTIEFTEDGHYTIERADSFKDTAQNSCHPGYSPETKAPFDFVIDKTAPVASVKVTNDQNFNGEYYQNSRKVFITVVDDNFDALKEMVEITAKDVNGNECSVPKPECGGKSMEITFDGDANYHFSLTDKFVDLAGNHYTLKEGSKEYAFTVDRSAPDKIQVEYHHTNEGLSGFFKELISLFTGNTVFFPDEVTAKIIASDKESGINRIVYSVPTDGDQIGISGIEETTVTNTEISESFSTEFKISAEYIGKVQATAFNNADLAVNTDEGEIAVSKEKPEVSLEITNEANSRLYNEYRYYKEDAVLRVTVEDVFFDAKGQNKSQLDTRNNLIVNVTTDDETVSLDIPETSEWTRIDNSNRYFTEFTLSKEGKKSVSVSYINNFGKSANTVEIGKFIIDKTAPQATIAYDNNSAVNEKYFSAPRTATIEVSDKYFEFTDASFDQTSEEKMFEIVAKDVNGDDVVLPQVDISEDKQKATITFTEDANYLLKPTEKFTDIATQDVILEEKSDTVAAYDFCLDKSAPEFLEVTYTNVNGVTRTMQKLVELFTGDFVNFKEKVVATITAKDIHSGINRIDYSAPQDEKASETGLNGGIELKTAVNPNVTGEYKVSFEIPAEFKGKVVATAYNNAELYTSSDENGFIVTKKEPTITLDLSCDKEPVVHENVKYYSKDVQVRVTVEDIFFNAQGDNLDLLEHRNNLIVTEKTNNTYINREIPLTEKWERIANTNRYYTDYTLESEGVKEFAVSYRNNVGVSAETKTIKDFVIDKTQPRVTISYDNNNVRNERYFNAARTATVKVSDHFFLGTEAMLNITQRNKNGAVTFNKSKIWSEDQQTATIVFEADAFYTFDLNEKFVDLAGNLPIVKYVNGTKAANDFVVDKTAPSDLRILIQGVDVNETINDMKLGMKNSNGPKYYNKPAKVTITANDDLLNPDDLKVEYSVDLSDATVNRKLYDGVFGYSPDRAFTVTAYAEDKSGNKVQIHSDRIILDKTAPDIDGLSPEIKLNPSSNNPKKDKDGETLYNGNVVVDFEITDRIYNSSCSGLNPSELKYEVLNNGAITQSGILNGSRTEFDGRLQKLSGAVTVEADKNNSNFVELVIYAKDNAENDAKDSAKLRIDITNPTIAVSYSNNTPDNGYNEYFNNGRTATIQITERNFNENKVVVKATKDGSSFVPSLSWSHSGTPNTDAYVHTATIDYSDDADYTFDVTYTDEADNQAGAVNYGGSVSPTKFTVDKTAPQIQISYDNNDASHGNYYSRNRIATITVTEHNFDPQRVTFSCTANDNGATVAAPGLSGWTSSGDIHTATVSFENNALFAMNISLNDMAGNAANTVEEQRFYVDTKKPDIKLEGIEKNSANKGDTVSFTLSTSDHNLDASSYDMKFTRIDLSAGDNANVYKAENEERSSTQITYSEKNLENDGIYRLICTATDMAGNKTTTSEIVNSNGDKMGEEEVLFSVNRFGSTFSIDNDVRDIIDKGYIKDVEKDIVITEVNPDKVEKYAVSLKVDNAQPKALNEGDNYSRVFDDNKADSWKRYVYTISKNNFSDEAAYSLALTTTDKAENISYSETKNPDYSKEPSAKINFVVDRTIPQVVVNNLEEDGHYNVDAQTVDIVANDDNLLQKVSIVLNGDVVKEYTEGELAENEGRMTLDIASSESLQNLTIEAVDAAGNSTNDTEDTEIRFKSFLVTTNLFIQFINNPVLVISSIAGVLLIAGGIVFLVLRKRKKIAK